MKSTDKVLVGIVVGAVLLVAVAFTVTLLRPAPEYQPEDTPEGVAHDYLLALQKGDYERAYGYLSPAVIGYPPTKTAFEQNVRDNSWSFQLGDTSTALQVMSSEVSGDRATVIVQKTSFRQGGLFDSSQYSTTFEVRLRQDRRGTTWKILDADDYWAPCWSWDSGCR